MNCEEIDELLAAYVLGALEPDEVEAVEAHLREGREHDKELVELRAAVFAMDRYREDFAPSASPGLRDRIHQLSQGPAGVQTLRAAPLRRPSAFPAWRGVAALVAALLIFGAGWVAASVLTDGGGDAYAVVLQGGGGRSMEVSGVTSSNVVTVTMDGLEQLPEANSYQVWAIRDDAWVSIGTCNTNDQGWWQGDFDFTIREGEAVALTIEPAGGSAAPTGEPVLLSTP